MYSSSLAHYRVFNLMLESAANLCITLTFWCFLNCCKNTFEGAFMSDLLQPAPLTALTPTLLCSILQSTMVLLGGGGGGVVLENHLVLEYVSQSGRKFGLFC